MTPFVYRNDKLYKNAKMQPLHDGLFTFEKVLRMHVQRMLEMSRCLYTGVNFKQNVLKKLIEN